MRFIVAILTVALAGPSVGSLVCDWTCAAKHQRTEAAGSCHQHSTHATTSTVAAGHLCHDLTFAPASILSEARLVGLSAPAIVEAPFTLSVESAGFRTHRTPDIAHAPPPILITSLRI